ncbi:MAG: aldehyde dehydrogenase [Actinobacteria bacterium]|nr:aldehyde dehydrogenase [Actinomycetota bacterium]MBI3688538.1 aldehyde dehydrogenase [Actinomycetota bacterium]
MRTYRSYVAGKEVDGDGWVYVLSPRALLDDAFASLTIKRKLEQGRIELSEVPPGVVVGRVAKADPRSVAEALEGAAAAAPEWGAFPLDVRVEAFSAGIYDRLVEHAETVVEMLVAEGHPLELARWEVSGMLDGLGPASREFYRSQMQWEYHDAAGRRLLVRRQPDGVVCVNPPANAPLSSALLATMAIAAGNAMVVRAPRSVPLGVMYAMRELVAPVLAELGAPPGVLSVLCGDPAPMLTAWVASPHVDDIMYFGSSENGIRFQSSCVEAGKKPILELAGNDVVVVWKDADLDCAAEALTESFYGSGQLCMIPNQALVHPDIADELIRLLVGKAERIRPGYPDEEGVLLTPVLRNDRFHACLRDALDKGATLVCGGHGIQIDGSRSSSGMFLEPTVVRFDGLQRARELDAVRRETFFPLLPVVVPAPADDDLLLAELVAFINSNAYGLRNSVWAADGAVIDRFVAEITNGGLLKINDSHIGFLPRLPTHGGTGLTGGVFGEANYPILRTSHVQGVAISATGQRPRDAVFGGWRALQATGRSLTARSEGLDG